MGTSAMSPNTPATLLLCLLNHWSTSVMASSQYPCNTSVMFPNPPWSTFAMMCSQYPCNTSVMSPEAPLLWCAPNTLATPLLCLVKHLCYDVSQYPYNTSVMSCEAPLLWYLPIPLQHLLCLLKHLCYDVS